MNAINDYNIDSYTIRIYLEDKDLNVVDFPHALTFYDPYEAARWFDTKLTFANIMNCEAYKNHVGHNGTIAVILEKDNKTVISKECHLNVIPEKRDRFATKIIDF